MSRFRYAASDTVNRKHSPLLQRRLLAESKNSVRTNAVTQNSSNLRAKVSSVPPRAPNRPQLVSRGATYIKVRWTPLRGTHPVLWNLLLNEVSVYSGREKQWEQTGLSVDTCFSFRVAYYENGMWSQFSTERRIATSVKKAVDIQALEALGEMLRSQIVSAAREPVQAGSCDLDGLREPGYAAGDDHSLEWIAMENPLAAAGLDASDINCKVVECSQLSSTVKSLQVRKAGALQLRLDNGDWRMSQVKIDPGSNVLQFDDPALGQNEGSVDLKGCRANVLNSRAMLIVDRQPPATDGCFEVNCTYTAEPMYFCGGHDFGALQRDEWIMILNRHSHPTHVISRYEVGVKLTATEVIPTELPKTVFEQVAYREPWALSWLQRLAQIGASPHFPLLYSFYRCNDMPKPFITLPGTDMGYLPPEVTGAKAAYSVEQMKEYGGTLKTLWGVMTTEAYSVTMQSIATQYKDYAVSESFIQGLMFQLIHALGVARKVFGFHHNDLLTLHNIKFKQIPFSVGAAYWCYKLNDVAFRDVHDGQPIDITHFSNFTFGELAEGPDKCEPPPPPTQNRETWCVPSDDVDGLQLKLHGFHNSALSRMELAYWVRGWTFMNTPWKDDMKDVAIIMCEMLGDKVAEPSDNFLDLCGRMRNGVYKLSPLQAIRHPFFDNLPTKDGLQPTQIDQFLYLPLPPHDDTEHYAVDDRPTTTTSTSTTSAPINSTEQRNRRKNEKLNTMTPSEQKAPVPLKQNLPTDSVSVPLATEEEIRKDKTEMMNDEAKKESSDLPTPHQPWIAEYAPGKAADGKGKSTTGLIKIAYSPPALAADVGPASIFQIVLNGVSVYSGPAVKGSSDATEYYYVMSGVKPDQCYRFQMAYFAKNAKKWSSLSSRLWVNDCNAFRAKLCREKGCKHGGHPIGPQST
eukprot:g5570.t1